MSDPSRNSLGLAAATRIQKIALHLAKWVGVTVPVWFKNTLPSSLTDLQYDKLVGFLQELQSAVDAKRAKPIHVKPPKRDHCKPRKHRHCQKSCHYSENRCEFIPITEIPSHGLTIDKPGSYKVCNTLTYNPSCPGTSAITIKSQDVTLDFNDFTLELGEKVDGTAGVTVDFDVQNFKMSRGRIVGFTDVGLVVKAGVVDVDVTDFEFAGNERGAYQLAGVDVDSYVPLFNLPLLSSQIDYPFDPSSNPSGKPIFGVTFDKVRMVDCGIEQAGPNDWLAVGFANGVNGLTLNDCLFFTRNDNTNLYGFYHSNSARANVVDNVDFTLKSGFDAIAHFLWNVQHCTSTAVRYLDFEADWAIGAFDIFGQSNRWIDTTVTDFVAKYVDGITSFFANGCERRGCTCKDSRSEQLLGGVTDIFSAGALSETCEISNNRVRGDNLPSIGIFQWLTSAKVAGVIVEGLFNDAGTAATFGIVDLYDSSIPRKNIVKACTVNNVLVLSNTDTYGIVAPHSQVTECFASNNGFIGNFNQNYLIGSYQVFSTTTAALDAIPAGSANVEILV